MGEAQINAIRGARKAAIGEAQVQEGLFDRKRVVINGEDTGRCVNLVLRCERVRPLFMRLNEANLPRSTTFHHPPSCSKSSGTGVDASNVRTDMASMKSGGGAGGRGRICLGEKDDVSLKCTYWRTQAESREWNGLLRGKKRADGMEWDASRLWEWSRVKGEVDRGMECAVEWMVERR